MSVYIKGMEMPKSCYGNCPFFTQIQPGIDHGLINYCCLENWKKPITPLTFSVDEAKQGRQLFCPLIPVPDHGRLGDLDELRTKMYHDAFEADTPLQKWDSGCWIRYKMFEDNIENAPTIIPADGNVTQSGGGISYGNS